MIVVPFEWEENGIENITDEADFLLKRKLEVAGLKVIRSDQLFVTQDPENKISTDKGNNLKKERHPIPLICEQAVLVKTDWVIAGLFGKMSKDPERESQGARIIGFQRIPIYCDLSLTLYQARDQEIKKVYKGRGSNWVPRFVLFNLHRSPFPKQPRTIDALIHDVIVKGAQDLSRYIQTK